MAFTYPQKVGFLQAALTVIHNAWHDEDRHEENH
jgi:hypothetical protein